MKRTAGYILGFVLMGVFLFILIFSGIKDLTAKQVSVDTASEGQLVEYGDIVYAHEVCTVQNKLWGLIPLFDDHYYLMMDGTGVMRFVVKAGDEWYNENFTSEGLAKTAVSVKGLLKEAVDENLELSKVNSQLGDLGSVDTRLYADSCYVLAAWLSIGAGLLFITAIGTIVLQIILTAKGVIQRSGAASKILIAAALIQAVGFIVLMILVNP